MSKVGRYFRELDNIINDGPFVDFTQKTQAKSIEEATDKLRELDTDQEFTPENVIRAIVDGFVPWVRFGGEK